MARWSDLAIAEDCLVEFVRSHGGSVEPQLLSQLYSQNSWLKPVVGNLSAWCAQSDDLRYLPKLGEREAILFLEDYAPQSKPCLSEATACWSGSFWTPDLGGRDYERAQRHRRAKRYKRKRTLGVVNAPVIAVGTEGCPFWRTSMFSPPTIKASTTRADGNTLRVLPLCTTPESSPVDSENASEASYIGAGLNSIADWENEPTKAQAGSAVGRVVIFKCTPGKGGCDCMCHGSQ